MGGVVFVGVRAWWLTASRACRPGLVFVVHLAEVLLGSVRASPAHCFDARCWWWEIFDCGRRLMLTGVLVFIKPESLSQIVWAALMAMAGLSMNCLWTPYADPLDDVVAISANCVLVINLLAGILIKTDVVGEDRYGLPPEGDDGYDRATFDGGLVFINVLVVMVAVAILFWQVAKGEEERQKEEACVDSEARRRREQHAVAPRHEADPFGDPVVAHAPVPADDVDDTLVATASRCRP